MRTASLAALAVTAVACAGRPLERIAARPLAALVAKESVAHDSAPKEESRLVPAEVYMRTYLQLFGGLSPLEMQRKARLNDGAALFDWWDSYVSVLGLPDYRTDVPRLAQTNAMMVATFERLGIALCDRAIVHDLPNGPSSKKPEPRKPDAKMTQPGPAAPASRVDDKRVVFDFDLPKAPMDADSFAARFDVLHRTFLGYPASLAPPERMPRFFALYTEIVKSHKAELPTSKLSPAQAGWAAVCYGLIRHPEFHLY